MLRNIEDAVDTDAPQPSARYQNPSRIGRNRSSAKKTTTQTASVGSASRAERWLDRFGWPLVPLAYLTVGVQSAVMAAAGILRMRWALFTVAQVPGAVAWALIYTTIGFAAWEALIGQAVGSWLGWLVLALAVLIGGSWLVTRRLRRAQTEK